MTEPINPEHRRVFLLVDVDSRQKDWRAKFNALNKWGRIIPMLGNDFKVLEDPLATYNAMLSVLEQENFNPDEDSFAWAWGSPFPLLLMGVLVEKYGANSFTLLQMRRERNDDGSYDDSTLRFTPVTVPIGEADDPAVEMDPNQLEVFDER